MRIVIDMQGAQTESRFRGIGRFSLRLAQAIVRARGAHEVFLALNGLFPDTIEPLRAEFDGLIPQECIRVWSAPGPTRELDPSNQLRREMAEEIREAFLADLEPDVVLITSLFEGFGDDAVGSVGRFDRSTPTAVILYDLIPLLNPDIHFRNSELRQNSYGRKIASLRNSQLLLAISESSREEALRGLGTPPNDVVNIFAACDSAFRKLTLSAGQVSALRKRLGVDRSIIMYTGGADERKNLHRLIEAFARLPVALRDRHQLLLAGKMPKECVEDFQQAAASHGLTTDDVVLCGYVSDEELIWLYNICELFVFPSTHEGFGLPPLEAMSCGAVVIAADAASLPEVMGTPESLFDPFSVSSISDTMARALTDRSLRERLLANGRRQSAFFSWDTSARRAWDALGRFEGRKRAASSATSPVRIQETSLFKATHKKILLLKLDHMGDFLLAVPAMTKLKARYPGARIDVVVGSWNVQLATELAMFSNIFVLDYFKRVSAAAPEAVTAEIDALVDRLDSYDIAIDLRRQRDTRFLLSRLNARLKVGYESFDQEIDSALDIKLESWGDVPFQVTPLNRTHASVQMLKLVDALPADINDYVSLPQLAGVTAPRNGAVALFPAAGNDVKEWGGAKFTELVGLLEADRRVDAINIYFGSAAEASQFPFAPNPKLKVHVGLSFSQLVESVSANRVCVANNSFGAHVAGYCGCIVLGVYGGHETAFEWGPVFGSGHVIHTAEFCSPCHIAKREDCAYAMSCLGNISVVSVFDAAVSHLDERLGNEGGPASKPVLPSGDRTEALVDKLVAALAAHDLSALDANARAEIAQSIARNHRMRAPRRQLLLDVSELVLRDAKSGIQRVVRSILGVLLRSPPPGYSVELVYASVDAKGYRYARNFKHRFLGIAETWAEDAPVEVWPGDIFFGLDLNPSVVVSQQEQLADWHRRGANIQFLIYDLLPVLQPQFFDEGTHELFQRWLHTVSRFDGAICISRTVADEMFEWLQTFAPTRARPFKLNWCHIGADLENSAPTRGLPADCAQVLQRLSEHPAFLMVGTLEPRKGHAQVLGAFEQLWQEGKEVILVIVGKEGWKVGALAERLRAHPQRGTRLFWLENISDEYLELIYAESSCLLAASEGEGYGLPLVEAARRKCPILARDIPVFREVAGSGACYFPDEKSPLLLSAAILEWLEMAASGSCPNSEKIPWLRWEDSTRRMVALLSDGKPYRSWTADNVHRYWGSDPRLRSWVGLRQGREISTSGQGGHLLFGPYLSLAAGVYEVTMRGHAPRMTGDEFVDVVVDQGHRQLARQELKHQRPGEWTFVFCFEADVSVNDLEVRLWVDAGTDMSVSRLEIAMRDNEGEVPQSAPAQLLVAIAD